MVSPIAIIAGNGALPMELAERLTARGEQVQIHGLVGEASSQLRKFDYHTLEWEQVGQMLRTFRQRGVERVCMAGGVVGRPNLRLTRMDFGALMTLPAVLSSLLAGDNAILTSVINQFEKRGFKICGIGELAPELLVQEGRVAGPKPSKADLKRIEEGIRLTTALGPFDVGQGCVVLGKRVVAVEGVEGTDEMLNRIGHLRNVGRLPKEPSGVLVKALKPGQDERVDLPTIGPGTVTTASKALLKGVAVQAHKSIILDRETVEKHAAECGLFVHGFRVS